MNGRYENGALPEKVRLLYEAVLAMVTDGWDINRMKVSDITAQAGIGKGTAYEYFSSKEEIIANAVLYDVEMRLAHVLEITKGEGDFAGKFVQILTYMEEVLSLIHISEPTRQAEISYAVFCLKKKKKNRNKHDRAKTSR